MPKSVGVKTHFCFNPFDTEKAPKYTPFPPRELSDYLEKTDDADEKTNY